MRPGQDGGCSGFLPRWDCCVAPVTRTGIRPSFPSLLTTAGLAAATHHVVSIWCHPSAQTSDVRDNAHVSIITVTCWEPTCWLQSRMSRLCAASQLDRTQMLPSVDMWCGPRERSVIKDSSFMSVTQEVQKLHPILNCRFNTSWPLGATVYTVKEALKYTELPKGTLSTSC